MAEKYEERGWQTKRERLEKCHAALKQLRAPWDAVDAAVEKYVCPGAGRFLGEMARGERQDFDLIDDAGMDALTTFRSGMMSSNTSQIDEWFTLKPSDPGLANRYAVQEWTQHAVAEVNGVLARSNSYEAFDFHYGGIGAFGTSAGFMVDHPHKVVHHHLMPVGQYCLATDDENTVNTCFREFSMTTEQVMRKWGRRASKHVQTAFDRGDYQTPVAIVHAVEPRRVRDPSKIDNLNMPWLSCYFEKGLQEDQVLSESGFEEFPVIAPRFMTYGTDVYGYGPGRRALGSLKALQQIQYSKALGIDKTVDPALQGPTTLKGQEHERNPGGFMLHDAVGAGSGVRPLHEVRLDLQWILEDVRDVRNRINRAFSADFWLMMWMNERTPAKTAREVSELSTEKLAMLAALKSRIDREMLQPIIEGVFRRLWRTGRLRPPPPELVGQELTIEFVGMLSMAQKMASLAKLDRFLGTIGGVAEFKREIMDRVDADGVFDTYAEAMSIPTAMQIPKDRAQPIRIARQNAQRAAAQAEMLEQTSGAARNLAASPTDKPNALTALAGGTRRAS